MPASFHFSVRLEDSPPVRRDSVRLAPVIGAVGFRTSGRGATDAG